MPGIAGEAELVEEESDRARKQGGEVDEEDIARNPKVARRPAAPTKAMIMAHEVHHADYREWCEHCVAGKGVSHTHRTSDRESRSDIAEFCLDYAFMTEEGNIRYREEIDGVDESGMSPVLIGHGRTSESLWAMVAESKGVTESSLKWAKERIDESGYMGTKVVLKSDQEESIKALKRAIAVKRQTETVMIESPVRDSKSNGSVERAVRTWAAQVRTLRHHLESRIKVKVPRTSALMTWLVAWSADVINRYKVRSSGRTSYEHITGHRGLQAITAFGEKVMFKYTADKTQRNLMETEWDTGYFIGINSRTTEYLIAKELRHILDHYNPKTPGRQSL